MTVPNTPLRIKRLTGDEAKVLIYARETAGVVDNTACFATGWAGQAPGTG